jgi:hypothetical protein
MKHLYPTLLLLFCTPLMLMGQNAATAEPKAERGRSAYFIYTSMPEGVENPVTILTGKDTQELILSKRMASTAVKIPADGILRLVRKLAAPPAPGALPYQIIAQAVIPETITQALVILVPIKPTPEGLLFQCKVQDLAAFKGGDYFFLNLTKANIAVDMGATKIPLKPGHSSIFDAPVTKDPVNMPIRYSYYDEERKEWNVISASTVVLYNTRREICIFSWDQVYDRIDYHGITVPVDKQP